MIAEILPKAYDIQGKRLPNPGEKRFKFFSPKFPLGRHIGHPLQVHCANLDDLRGFLIEATTPRLSAWLPRLRAARYVPVISVAWENGEMVYYEHQPRKFRPSLALLVSLQIEKIFFWIETRPGYCYVWIRYRLYKWLQRLIPAKTVMRPPRSH
ncbi:MAG: hypothetical protein EHM45_24795 [Desulfobacteraceae bacterium]|nr:MAG: hypothetical protein EHM45_24795 [Desulfobacteraceae bacterium]